jgi:hypothetical protein
VNRRQRFLQELESELRKLGCTLSPLES